MLNPSDTIDNNVVKINQNIEELKIEILELKKIQEEVTKKIDKIQDNMTKLKKELLNMQINQVKYVKLD